MMLPAMDDASRKLADSFLSAPVTLSAAVAKARIAGWLVDLPPHQSASIASIAASSHFAGVVLNGIAEFSPYLFDLIRADPARLLRLLACNPDIYIARLVADMLAGGNGAIDEADLMGRLRRIKAEAALLIALCDIGGVWPVTRVTQALTDLAVAAVQAAIHFSLMQETARGRLIPPDTNHPEIASGLIVLAMGKMGAGELNYSSDIDLIVFYDPSRACLADGTEPSAFFVRLAQGLPRLLQQRTSDGYVFRVDLRLRPDPSSTSVAVSTGAALNYYEREGRTWERAAMIKASACAGDEIAGAALLAELSPFVWRKHLDFAALHDVHDMKLRMQAFRGQTAASVAGYNVKLGRGGIREIEFFVQTQQLIAGGRHPELRARGTLKGLAALADSNWITFQARDELSTAYEFLRRVEHRLQMIADEQTHVLPEASGDLDRVAHFLGYEGQAPFAAELLRHLNRVQRHYDRLFEGDPTGSAKLPEMNWATGAGDPLLLPYLDQLGFRHPRKVADTVKCWLSGHDYVVGAEPTRRSFAGLMPALIAALSRAADPDVAVTAMDRFLHALRRAERLIFLLKRNPDFIVLLALIIGVAPRLSDMLSNQPQLMDGLVDPRFFGAMPERSDVSGRLSSMLANTPSHEEFLDRLRLFGQESLFLIGTRLLSGTVSARQAGRAFADVAEGIVDTARHAVTEQFVAQHGRIAEQETAILAMGKLGSREMTAASDLDLILIYDFDENNPASNGRRSFYGSEYFSRLTQRLIGAFTTRTNTGVLYDIDMRLRPSGRSGPLASHIDAFGDYQNTEAWTWEHMALTRARVISGSPAFRKKIEDTIRVVLTRRRDRSAVANDVLEMREAIAQENGDRDSWDIKHAAGGLIDIEFLAQYLQLVHAADAPEILDVNTAQVLENAARLGCLSRPDAETLRAAARFYHDLTQIMRLCVSGPFTPETAGEDLRRVLARSGDAPDFSALDARLRETQADVREIFLRVLHR